MKIEAFTGVNYPVLGDDHLKMRGDFTTIPSMDPTIDRRNSSPCL
jgi:hypothetical protein